MSVFLRLMEFEGRDIAVGRATGSPNAFGSAWFPASRFCYPIGTRSRRRKSCRTNGVAAVLEGWL
jgi:hypothetical protein